MSESDDFFRVQNYYKFFSHCSLPAVFLPLTPGEVECIAAGEITSQRAALAIERLNEAMSIFPGKHFISVDYVAPTDSPRYLSGKRGAVVSAESAWHCLIESMKVREQAASGNISNICIRAFRVFDVPREFRLFVKDGMLAAMSQRFLIRHFRRLENRCGEYWSIADLFVQSIQNQLPVRNLVIDIYITSKKKVIVVDVNQWGPPTETLMVRSWDEDFSKPMGCLIVPKPQVVSGNVNVSF